jgi:biofilm PGA synthesis N-glycosyltransferase PgaC
MECNRQYVLITPAKNEVANIGKTINSILAQTHKPSQWIIISDGSTDGTDELVQRMTTNLDFVTFVRVEKSEPGKNYCKKVEAIKYGISKINDNEYFYIGNLDADVSFDCNYFEKILYVMERNPMIGIAGGWVHQVDRGSIVPFLISDNSVSGAVQLFKRECYEQIGGYLPISIGGIDSAAEIMAREKGWEVSTLRHLKVFHYGKMLTGNKNMLQTRFNQGCQNYLFGYHPFFQLASCFYRILKTPVIAGSVWSMAGFLRLYLKKEKHVLPESTVEYLQKEQLERLVVMIKNRWNKIKNYLNMVLLC